MKIFLIYYDTGRKISTVDGGIENMKIIKAGKIPSPEEKKFVCSYCKCEFIADVYDTRYSQRDHEAYVECPTCNRYITW